MPPKQCPHRLSCWVATAMLLLGQISAHADGITTSPSELLLGCWERHSPFASDQIPHGKNEWGSQTWCFRVDGRIQILNVGCGRFSDCDGWEEEAAYRLHNSILELPDWDYANNVTIRHRCRLTFEATDRM